MNLNDLYKRVSEKFSKDELQTIYYNNTKHYMETWSVDNFNVSWYFMSKIILDYYKIEKKPRDIWVKQRNDHMLSTKKEKYENGNYDYDKFSNTMNERYGGIGNSSPEIFEKQKKKMVELYGVEFPSQSDELNKNMWTPESFEKGRQTLFEKTGYYYNWDNPDIGGKGREHSQKNPESRNKAVKSREITLNNLPGGKKEFYKNVSIKRENTINSYEGGREKFYSDRQKNINKFRKYLYNNIRFDSSWELIYYIYCKDHNINIKRCEDEHYEYFYNNKKYLYYPDFIVNGEFIDIKGDHYLNDDGSLRKVYKNQNLDKLKCKYKCMIDNNVKLLSSEDLKKEFEYCKEKFGTKDWFKDYLVYNEN